MYPAVRGCPSRSTPGSVWFAIPPPMRGRVYVSTVSPFTTCLISESPSTSASMRTHWSPAKVAERELMQCCVTSVSCIITCVPGVHRLAVVRGAPVPPRSCASSEMGKSCRSPMDSGDWECSITPLLRIAHASAGPAPAACWPTKRYSTAST